MTDKSDTKHRRVDVDDVTRADRSFESTSKFNSDIGIEEAWNANIKRMYDEYLAESLTDQRRSRDRNDRLNAQLEEQTGRNRMHFDNMLGDARELRSKLDSMFLSHVQNTLDGANQVNHNVVHGTNAQNQQTTQHRDVATDRIWNVDEVAQAVAKNPVFQDAIVGAVIAAVGKATQEKAEKKY